MKPRVHLLLATIRDVLADEDRWCQFDSVRDGNDTEVVVESKAACQFCLVGALAAAAFDLKYPQHIRDEARSELIDTIVSHTGVPKEYASIIHFNDTSSHKQVLELLDKTLERA